MGGAAAAAPAAAAAAAKEAAKGEPPVFPVLPKMPVLVLDGVEYWHDPSSNGLWEKTDEDGSGPWIGYYMPEDDENPIRFTEFFGSE